MMMISAQSRLMEQPEEACSSKTPAGIQRGDWSISTPTNDYIMPLAGMV